MLVSCPSCGKRISDRAPACPFCKASTSPDVPPANPDAAPPPPEATVAAAPPAPEVPAPPPPEAPAPEAAPIPEPMVPVPHTYDPNATLPPSPALFQRGGPDPFPIPKARSGADTDAAALEAAQHLIAGRYEAALTTIDRLLAKQPRNGAAHSTRAQALSKLGRADEAAHAIQKAIEASPDSLPFWLSKAEMEQQAGKAKDALRSALDLVEIALNREAESPLVERAHQIIATLEATGAFPNSRGYLGWLGLGCVTLKAGRAENALGFFDRAIDAASSKPDGFRWKGKALTQLEQVDEAFVLFDAALESDPNDAETHYERGLAFSTLGDSAKATEAFDAALKIDPHHAGSLREKKDLAS